MLEKEECRVIIWVNAANGGDRGVNYKCKNDKTAFIICMKTPLRLQDYE